MIRLWKSKFDVCRLVYRDLQWNKRIYVNDSYRSMRKMKRRLIVTLILASPMLFTKCGGEEPKAFVPPIDNRGEACQVLENGWTISTQTVVDGGVGKDGIPSIDKPLFVAVNQAQNMTDDELVIVVKVGGIIKAYPQRVLDVHEIVNDTFGDQPIAVTLCPQTGTALAFDRTINGEVTTLGVSGLLYNSNLVMYDRNSDTRWAQMTSQAVNGALACDDLTFSQTLEMTWEGVRTLFPEALVLAGDDGLNREYKNPPLSSRTPLNSLPTFPYTPKDLRKENYERVHAIIDTVKVQVYSFDQFDNGLILTIDNSNIILSHSDYEFIISYKSRAKTIELGTDPNNLDVVMKDSDGNGYNIFGEVIAGDLTVGRLEPTFSYMGYWFAMAAMFPNPIVFENGSD